MKHEAEIKDVLINNAIQLIAEGGFEKATTKELTHYSGDLPDMRMNETYIYRLFGSKEKLYEEAFLRLDRELHDNFMENFTAVSALDADLKEKLYQFFLSSWNFILKNEARCRCFVRYYYSVYFTGNSEKEHKRMFDSIIKSFSPLFKEEADVVSIMHSVFIMLFDFGIRVYSGNLENNDENRPHIFNVLYCMMATYFKR